MRKRTYTGSEHEQAHQCVVVVTAGLVMGSVTWHAIITVRLSVVW